MLNLDMVGQRQRALIPLVSYFPLGDRCAGPCEGLEFSPPNPPFDQKFPLRLAPLPVCISTPPAFDFPSLSVPATWFERGAPHHINLSS